MVDVTFPVHACPPWWCLCWIEALSSSCEALMEVAGQTRQVARQGVSPILSGMQAALGLPSAGASLACCVAAALLPGWSPSCSCPAEWIPFIGGARPCLW